MTPLSGNMPEPFDWAEYLSGTGQEPVVQWAFEHVQYSARTLAELCLLPGTVVRVDSADGRLGVLELVHNRMVRVRLLPKTGGDDGDFDELTFDVNEIHPLLEIEFNDLPVVKQTKVKALCACETNSSGSSTCSTASSPGPGSAVSFLCNRFRQLPLCQRAIDLLQPGQLLELQNEQDPRLVSLAVVKANAGGLLRVCLLNENSETGASEELSADWMNVFWTNERLHPVEWCSESPVANKHQCKYANKYSEKFIQRAKENSVPAALFELPQRYTPQTHRFEVGMRLEMLDVRNRVEFVPAAVVESLNPYYVVIEADRLQLPAAPSFEPPKPQPEVGTMESKPEPDIKPEESIDAPPSIESSIEREKKKSDSAKSADNQKLMRKTVHSASSGVFHVYWAERNSIRLQSPIGFDKLDFSWQAYRAATGLTCSDDAPAHVFDWATMGCREHLQYFRRGSRLEVIDPDNHDQLLCATITRTSKHLLWIHLDSRSFATHSTVYDFRSTDLFPCGWAAEHNVKLIAPANHECLSISTSQSACRPIDVPKYVHPKVDWLSHVLYINVHHHCLGPYLNVQRMALMPQSIGPGPVPLILQTIIRGLIAGAHRPSVLLELWSPDAGNGFKKQSTQRSAPSSSHRNQYQLSIYENNDLPFGSESSTESGIIRIPIKARVKGRRYRGQVAAPAKLSKLADYINRLLSQIDACPMLISTQPISTDQHSCPMKCYETLMPLPFLSHSRHPCTSFVKSSRPSRTAKRRLKRAPELLANLCQPPAAKRPRKRITNNNSGSKMNSSTHLAAASPDRSRRPVTRGIQLPKYNSNGIVGGSPTVAAATRVKRRATLKHTNEHHRGICSPVRDVKAGQPIKHHSAMDQSASSIVNVRGKPMGIATPQRHTKHTTVKNTVPVPAQPTQPSVAAVDGMCASSTGCAVPAVESNPNEWVPRVLADWLSRTDHVAPDMINKLVNEDVDGQAFMLLSLRDCMEYLGMRLGPALKLVSLVHELKQVHHNQYMTQTQPAPSITPPPVLTRVKY